MFHSEHADLCRLMGFHGLAEENEDGYAHDSKCLRKVHRIGIDHTGALLPEGRQERSHVLDAYQRHASWDIDADMRRHALECVLDDMVEWEEGTCDVLRRAHACLLDRGEATLAKCVRRILEDTEEELALYRHEHSRFESVNWDLELAMWRG